MNTYVFFPWIVKKKKPTYFHWMLFFDFFSSMPIPSNTLVISYILRFWTSNLAEAMFKSTTPSDEFCKRLTNFFVNKPSDVSYRVEERSCFLPGTNIENILSKSMVGKSTGRFYFKFNVSHKLYFIDCMTDNLIF